MPLDVTYNFTDPVVLTFVVMPVLLVATLLSLVSFAARQLEEAVSTRRRAMTITAAVAAAWMTATWIAAARGVLRDWDATPPPLGLLVAGVIIVAGLIASGSYGRRLATGVPLWILVGVQAFRLPLELAMHALYERGIMPVQMSYSGRNFDILTGLTALVVAALLKRGWVGNKIVLLWNVLGLMLLVNVVTIALLSTPRFRYFGDTALNVFVTYPPFVWLPAVMVVAALAGHLLIFRALRRSKLT